MRRALCAAAVVLAGCGDLVGLGGEATPLARVQVEVTGDLTPLRPALTEREAPRLRVALLWGAQWQPEPFCFLPPESSQAAAVIAAGCPDSFGFVPDRVAANVDVEIGVPAALELFELPAADVMVGDVTARVAYGSLVAYDDRDGSGTLELWHDHGDEGGGPGPDDVIDVVYGASFLTMTGPDQRLAFREGDFNAGAAFYPRSGCAAPPRGFSVLGAGGFSAEDAVAAVLRGELPPEDPAACATGTLDDTVVVIPVQAPDKVGEVVCLGGDGRGPPHYHEADISDESPDLVTRTWACAGLPSLGGEGGDPGIVQLVVSGPPDDVCKGLTHFALRGCDDDAACDLPEWDFTATPPLWWPCPAPTSPPPAR